MDPENRAAINMDGVVGVARCARSSTVIARLPADGRRPLSADRVQMERLFALRQRGLCPRPHARRRDRAARRNRRAHPGDAQTWLTVMRYLVLVGHPRQHRRARRGAGRRRRAVGTARWCSAISSATAPNRTRSSIASARSNRTAHPRQSRQGRVRHRRRQRLQLCRAHGRRMDQRSLDEPDHASDLRALPMGPPPLDALTEICHGAPFDEDHYIFDEPRRAPRPRHDAAAALPVRPHPPAGGGAFGRRSLRRKCAGPGPRERGAAAARRAVFDQRGIGRPAARWRSACGLRGARRRGARSAAGPAALPVERAQQRILSAGLPPSLATRLGLGR